MLDTLSGKVRIIWLKLDDIYVRFGDKVYRQVVGIPMGTNCVPLIADFFSILLWIPVYDQTQ